MMTVWRDGSWVDRVGLDASVFERGEGLFETLLVREGRPALVERHLERLYASAERAGLSLPDRTDLATACAEVPARNQSNVGRLRIIVDHGQVLVALTPFDGYPDEYYRDGAVAQLASAPGHPLGDHAGEKVLPYAPLMEPRAVAEAEGAVDIVFWDSDRALLEGSASNLFVVDDQGMRTPPLSRRILPGVVRQVTIDAAQRLGIALQEEDIFLEELGRAQEVFITSSMREVMPLRRLGALELRPGPVAMAMLVAVRASY